MTTFSPGILETLEVVSSSTAQASGICPSLAPESFFPVHGQLLSLKSASSVYQNPFVPLTPTLFPKILSVSYIIIGSGINTFIRCFLYSMHCAVCFVSLFHLLFTRPLERGGEQNNFYSKMENRFGMVKSPLGHLTWEQWSWDSKLRLSDTMAFLSFIVGERGDDTNRHVTLLVQSFPLLGLGLSDAPGLWNNH